MPDCRTVSMPDRTISLDQTRIMAILNVTPDSFYDGGTLSGVDDAVARAEQFEAEGADFIDIGGESTRPGSPRLDVEEEKRRLLPVVEAVAKRVSVPISVDTYKASVARSALDVGASIINDVTALRGDEGMVKVVAQTGCPVVLMHAIWPPETMQDEPTYVEVVEDVLAFLNERIRFAIGFGVKRDRIIIDPGLGFGKALEHNLELLRGLPQFLGMGYPLLVGPSRKRFLGELLDVPPEERLWGTAGAVAVCAASGAHIVRVHDVKAMRHVARVVDAVVWQV